MHKACSIRPDSVAVLRIAVSLFLSRLFYWSLIRICIRKPHPPVSPPIRVSPSSQTHLPLPLGPSFQWLLLVSQGLAGLLRQVVSRPYSVHLKAQGEVFGAAHGFGPQRGLDASLALTEGVPHLSRVHLLKQILDKHTPLPVMQGSTPVVHHLCVTNWTPPGAKRENIDIDFNLDSHAKMLAFD